MSVQPIRIFTTDFKLLGEIDDYESLQFTRRSTSSGGFEIHINLNKNLTETLQVDNLVYLSPTKVGIIRHREINRDSPDELIIKGYTLQEIIGRRITEPPTGESHDSIKAPLETVMKHYVKMNAITPRDSTRTIPNLVIAEDKGRGPVVSWDSRYQQLDEELFYLATDTMGWNVHLDLDKEQFIFDIIEGRDLSVNQTDNPPVIFSIDFDNIRNQTFVDSGLGYRNTAYVGGQGEGAYRAIAEVGDDSTGLQRIEMFVDARDIDNDELLPYRGMSKLREFQKIVSFESEILTYGPFIYEKDWNVGDIVTVQDAKLGLTLDTPIPEVKEIYEQSGFRLEATFGNTVPTLIDKIKQTIDTPMVEHAFVPSKTSDLENDAGYVTEDELQDIVSDKSYTHVQMSPSSTWIIIHNLNKHPSVTISDSAGNIVLGDVNYESMNKVTLTFTAQFAGRAYFN